MNPYQWLVDWSQRRPAWWAKQFIILYAVLRALQGGLGLVHWGWVILSALICVFFYAMASNEAWFHRVTSIEVALQWLFRVSFVVGLMLPDYHPLSSTVAFVWMSIWEFQACRPPKPPRKTFRGALQV